MRTIPEKDWRRLRAKKEEKLDQTNEVLMNINATKQELVMLLRLANIGDWVMFSDLNVSKHSQGDIG